MLLAHAAKAEARARRVVEEGISLWINTNTAHTHLGDGRSARPKTHTLHVGKSVESAVDRTHTLTANVGRGPDVESAVDDVQSQQRDAPEVGEEENFFTDAQGKL